MNSTERIKIILIAAMAKETRVIGVDGGLPWRLPADLQHFKRKTLARPVIMGRKTFESIGRALPGRPNLVVSRAIDFSAPGCDVFSSLDAAIERAKQYCLSLDQTEIMIIGGATIYEQVLPRADGMLLTFVDAPIKQGVLFPSWEDDQWQRVSYHEHDSDADNEYAYAFAEYCKK